MRDLAAALVVAAASILAHECGAQAAQEALDAARAVIGELVQCIDDRADAREGQTAQACEL